MKATRKTQPYRGGKGPAGASLAAMLMGKGRFMPNPAEASNRAKKQLHARKRIKRRRVKSGSK